MNKPLVMEREFHALASENEVLRAKAKKINEIQSYVNVLMQSNQSYQQQITKANQENRQLKNKNDNLMASNIQQEKHYESQLLGLSNQFNRQLAKKQQQIRFLKTSKQKENYLYQQALNESQSRAKNDIQRLKLQIYHIETQYQAQLKTLTSALSDRSRELQSSQDGRNQMKKAYIEESNNLGHQISNMQRAFHDLQSDHFRVNEECLRLTQVINRVTQSQNNLKKQLSKREEESLLERRNWQKRCKNLDEQLNEISTKQKKLQSNFKQLFTQSQSLKKQSIFLGEQNNDLKLNLKKMERLLLQKEQQIKQFTIKCQHEDDQLKRLNKRHFEQLKRLQEELTLTNERFLCQKRNAENMKIEIEDLLKVIDKLEQNSSQTQHNVQMLNKENQVLFKQVQALNKQTEVRAQQLSQYESKFKSINCDLVAFEELYKKETSKSKLLQIQNTQLASKLQKISNQIQKAYEDEINDIINKNLAQKREFLQNNRVQKENIIKQYEQALREKDEQAKKRLLLLEDEINLMRVKH